MSLEVEKSKLYCEFMVDFYRSIGTSIAETRKGKKEPDKRFILEWARRIREFNARCTMVASDAVIQALIEYNKIGQDADRSGSMAVILVHFAKITVLMRKDLDPNTKITEEDILRTLVVDIDEHPDLLEALNKK